MTTKWFPKYAVLIIAILCLVSRLPQLLSPYLFLDGDECIEGLMAKHFSEGKDIPWFFYGQSYGFSFIEVVFISIFYPLAGVSDIAVKLAMLLMWTIGIIFFYKTLKIADQENNKWAAFLITLIFIFLPSWAIWSMKARGGYLTAFLFTNITTYLLFIKNTKRGPLIFFIVGLLLTIIYQSQPLWLMGLLPVAVYQLFSNKQIRLLIYTLSGTTIGIFIFYLIKKDISNFWHPDVFDLSAWEFNNLIKIPEQVYNSTIGSYEYTFLAEVSSITRVLAFIFTGLVLALPVFVIIKSIKKEGNNSLVYILFFSVLITVVSVTITDGKNPRYLLPLTGFALFLFYLLINRIIKKTVVNIFLGSIIVLGNISLYSFKNYSLESKPELISLIKGIEAKKTTHVYCDGGLLQWEIMFYSNERIIARYKSSIDRYQQYIEQVDEAFNKNIPTGLVGYYNPTDSISNSDFITPEKKFYFIEKPGKNLLIDKGFEFSAN